MAYSLESTNADCYEGTSVLINKIDIRNEKQLMETEGFLTNLKAIELMQKTLENDFDFYSYKQLHKYMFDELYDWAGEIRTINISKSSTNFVHVNEIEPIGEKIFQRLKLKNYLVDLDKSAFVQEIAELYHSINMLHPFREGNGRVQRVFFVQLIRNAGYDIDYSELNSELLMIGTIQAASGVMDNLKKFFEENVTAD